ncbi:hypothetical protein Amir_4968 [Actinosynnema mirum DSM 43827]|uniref:Uncharacterized protein n=2 Tax=Actinosynnema TaxID=40566 RepID=C6WQV4_ACTMD|nr:hypothetical protein Amir_4968 [Actinosynnema mirum DSM 43827]
MRDESTLRTALAEHSENRVGEREVLLALQREGVRRSPWG